MTTLPKIPPASREDMERLERDSKKPRNRQYPAIQVPEPKVEKKLDYERSN